MDTFICFVHDYDCDYDYDYDAFMKYDDENLININNALIMQKFYYYY